MRGEKPSWSAKDKAVAIICFLIVTIIFYCIIMAWINLKNIETNICISFLGIAFSYVILNTFFVEHRFKLENSRQFVMRADTAADHNISKKDKDGYVTMEYYGKKYYYTVIRVALKTFTWAENHHTIHDTRMYFIIEKKTDSQPPNYPYMAQMREKEKLHKNKYKSSLR